MKRNFLSVLVAGCFGTASAAPTLPQVVAGQAAFGQQGNVFTITNTPNTIINWQSFSVNAGEVTRFVQQGADSAVLNRITGQDPSRILGALQSNGQVFLINPNGVLFGRGARVDVAGLTASSLALSDADFLAGRRSFSAGAVAGKVVNNGAISALDGGKVFLIAPNVENNGVIASPKGEVVLAAGHAVQLVDSANPDLRVVVTAPAGEAVNLGQLVSQGGSIGIYGALVRQRGVVNANSAVRGEGGKIILKASGDTLLEAGSVTTAAGAGRGGQVSVLGERVALTGDARIDASGKAGGGTVLVGGGFQGRDAALPNAKHTWVGRDASIRADATGSGGGGTVVLWSDGSTRAYGHLSARGGAAAGNGGLVETSGKYLDTAGASVDTRAPAGHAGTWLLDPMNIEVVLGGTASLADADLFSEGPGATTRINPAQLNGATTNVVLQATNDISFLNAVSMASPAASLTAQAGNNINVNAALSTAGGAVTLSANHPEFGGPGTGSVNVNAAVNTSGGKFKASADSIVFNAGASTGGGDMDLRAASALALNSGATLASGGFIDIKADNVRIDGAIGGALRPNVSFTPFSAGRDMGIASSKTGTGLVLTPVELNRIQGYAINLGSSASTGTLTVSADYTAAAGATPNLVLESGGSVVIGAAIDLSTNHAGASHAVLGRFGTGFGEIALLPGSSLKSASIAARSDSMSIGGQLDAGIGSITLTPNNGATGISLGGTAAAGGLGLSNAELAMLRAGALTIGGNDGQSGGVSIDGAASFAGVGKVTLDAGTGNLALKAPLGAGDLLSLKSANQIVQGAGATITAPLLEARAALVDLGEANAVRTVAGAASTGTFSFGAAGDLSAGAAGASTGVTTTGGAISLTAGGVLSLDRAVNAGAGRANLNGAGVQALGGVSANSVVVRSSRGVGTDASALRTSANYLWIDNNHQGGASTINVANTGDLVIGSVTQSGLGSTGSIKLDNGGSVSLPFIDPNRDARSYVRAEGGNVSLSARGPIDIEGEISTQRGNVTLAATGSALTVRAGGIVATGAGNVALTGDTVANSGTVTATGGTVNTVQTSIPAPPVVTPPVVTPPVVTPPVVTPPVVEPPVVTPPVVTPPVVEPPVVTPPVVTPPVVTPPVVTPPVVTPPVVTPPVEPPVVTPPVVTPPVVTPPVVTPPVVTPPVVEPPVVVPAEPSPPTLSQCTATPSLAGCSAVLPTLQQCSASPALQGCSAVVPPVDICTIAPTSALCRVVTGAPSSDPAQNGVGTVVSRQTGIVQNAAGGKVARGPDGPATSAPTADEKKPAEQAKNEDKPETAPQPTGSKDENRPKAKTYCN